MYSGNLVAPWKIGQKTNSHVWLPRNSFFGKSIPMFGLVKHFTENGIHFMENQFPCLVRSNILRKMEFVLWKINSHVWFVQTFYGKYEMPSNLCGKIQCSLPNNTLKTSPTFIHLGFIKETPALPKQTCNSTKIIIHFNLQNNHPNIPIIFISKQPQCTFTIGITPPWCTKMIPTRAI